MRDAIIDALKQVEGSFSFVFATKKDLLARARSLRGAAARPRAVGESGDLRLRNLRLRFAGRAKYVRDRQSPGNCFPSTGNVGSGR